MHTTTVDLTDAGLWARPDIRSVIDDLRGAGAVQRTETAGEGSIWSLLSHEVCARVLTDAATFSSASGSLLGSGSGTVPAGSGRMMALTDPPRHRQLRASALPFFSGRGVEGAADRIGQLAASAVGRAVERGEVDLVDVVSAVPLAVMCDLLDIPAADRDLVVRVCDDAFLATTVDERTAGHRKLLPYLLQQVMQRRSDPRADLVSALATYRVDGELLPIEDVVLNLDNILVGGVQTVRHTAAMSIWTLLRHPELWRRLQRREVGLDTAVDELLRWTSVGLHVLRTATAAVELGGSRIEAGDRVVVWTWAANHDPAVFEHPEHIRLDRSPNRHLALGHGPHYCIGGPLAKAELTAIYAALLEQVSSIELAGTPVHNRSIINFGFDHLPVRLRPR